MAKEGNYIIMMTSSIPMIKASAKVKAREIIRVMARAVANTRVRSMAGAMQYDNTLRCL